MPTGSRWSNWPSGSRSKLSGGALIGSCRHLAAFRDQVGASPDPRVIADHRDDGLLVNSGIAGGRAATGHSIPHHLKTMAAMEAVDRSRQDGLVQRKSHHDAAD